MNKLQTIVLTGSIFGFVALGLAVPSVWPQARANENPAAPNVVSDVAAGAKSLFAPPPPDLSGLVKFDYTFDPSVSTAPVRQSIVTKIAGGRVTTVQVTETSSGVYSSDALNDPHVLYPGVHRTRHHGDAAGLLYLDGPDWIAAVPIDAKSFVSIQPIEGGQLVITDDSSCSYTIHGISC